MPLSTAVRRRRTQAGLAAAAAVVAVVLGVTTFGGGDAGNDGDRAALMSDTSGSATGPDLGDQSDPKALADRLRTAVEGEAVTEMAPTDEGGEADRTETGQAASGGGSAAGSAADSTADSAPAAATVRREGLAAKTTSRSGGPCTATATSEYGRGLAGLAFQGTLRWEGTPAVVLVYRIDGATGPLDHRVLVLARDDCRLLVAQTF